MTFISSTSSAWKKLDYVIGDIDPDEKNNRDFHKDMLSIIESHSEMQRFGSAVRLLAKVNFSQVPLKSLFQIKVWRSLAYHTYRRQPDECLFITNHKNPMNRLQNVIKACAANSVVYDRASYSDAYGVLQNYGLIWKDRPEKGFFGDIRYVFILEEGTQKQIDTINEKHYLYPEGFTSKDGLKIWHFLD